VRVTERQIFDRAARASEGARSDLARATGELSSGRRVQRPFDDPAATSRLLRLEAQAERADGIAKSAVAARGELDFADRALDGVELLLTRVKELAVTYANDTYDATAKAQGADEVGGLVRSLTALLNQKLGERFVFAGDLTDQPPFREDGSYLGDDGVRTIELGVGVYEEFSVRADVVIKGAAGGVDVYQALFDLQSALAAGDTDAVRASIGGLDASLRQVSQGRTRVGATTTVVEAAESAVEMLSITTRRTVGEVADVDFVDAASRLQAAQTALQASLEASKRSFSLTLLDKL
jgi:flagellar hook-associated protein 3 FlgL